MEKVKVVFIGGLSNGKIVYDYLLKNKYVSLELSITYPEDYKGPRYVIFKNENNIIKTLKANNQIDNIRKIKPDYIFVVGWSELIGEQLLNIPKKGTIGFHPAKLPKDRGRSVIAWQIEEGYKETGLTMFYYNNIPDSGDIIATELITIEENDYINDVLDKIDKATYNLMRAYFPLLRVGKAPRKKQSINEGSFRRLRKNMDSEINWNDNSINIYNKIRAISKPYPGAEGLINGEKYKIWESQILDFFPYGINEKPGILISSLYDGSFIVKTRDGFLRITEYEQ